VDHPFPSYSPWRTRALVASAVAALELLALLGVGAAAVMPPLIRDLEGAARERQLAPAAPTKPKPAKAAERALLARSETSVVVLNGNGISGAASESADRVRALAYVVAYVGNAPNRNEGRTVIMFRPGYEPEAKRLARDLRVKLVGPLDGLHERDLMGAHVAVVVGH
jgi:hypothetical protein